jgi:protein-disulfide isomerase
MTRLRTDVGSDDHVLGPSGAPVTLLEYGDYQCPFCGKARWEVRRLLGAIGDRVRFVYRHFPLSQLHPHAVEAAEAAEAAGAQGRFWEMHDLLFENQDALDPPALLSYAEVLELDVPRFEQDLLQHRFADKVRRDFMSGARSGVNGTPTFFVNGFRHDGPHTAEALLATVEGAEAAHP